MNERRWFLSGERKLIKEQKRKKKIEFVSVKTKLDKKQDLVIRDISQDILKKRIRTTKRSAMSVCRPTSEVLLPECE